MKKTALTGVVLLFAMTAFPQITSLLLDKPNTAVINGVTDGKNEINTPYGLPVYSVIIDSNFYTSFCSKPEFRGDVISQVLGDSTRVTIQRDKKFKPGIKYTIRFTNEGKGNRVIENLVPLGEGTDKVYITATGTKAWPQYLCRSVLYIPGHGPVGVILPDNAWHLGFADFRINDTLSVTALARRGSRDKENTGIDRWATTLKPGGWMEYDVYFDIHKGDWHEGLRMMFQQRWLYDLPSFDSSMYARADLKWMKDAYIMLLQFAWDKKYYDYASQTYTFYKDFFEFDSLTGGYDIFTLWPTWPRLGLDQRNQWDMYRDLPGGLQELTKQSAFIHSHGKKYFISYNPWDEGTRREDQMKGMEDLLRATDADGVVLDTRGESSKELQATADRVKPGVIMYSEGMAVPRDMPGIVSGRVHDALVLPPPVNLNKLIKPDFAIFRVLQLADDRLHRELAIAFFNGYGVEINTMRPGRPVWMKEEFQYMGRTSKILRENTSVFHNYDFMPLIASFTDSIYINRFTNGSKTVYTIYSLKPEGFDGPLFSPDKMPEGHHCIDLWNHIEIELIKKNNEFQVAVAVEPFERSWLNTRREGNVGCVAVMPSLLKVELNPDTLLISASAGDKIVLTGENPSYSARSFSFSNLTNKIAYHNLFPETTEKIVVQAFGKGELLDERVVYPIHNVPGLVSSVHRTPGIQGPVPQGMVTIPSGEFRFYTKRDPKTLEPFIPFPDHTDTVKVNMKEFYMDRYPVTNSEFKSFLDATGYKPVDTTKFLAHWKGGTYNPGDENMPVVYINMDDARAYAAWAGKRLPTEMEWQYAAQGTDMRKYPWGNSPDSTRCNSNLNHPTPVNEFPGGASPFGVEDLIGNVWQMTNDVYDDGAYYFTIIRGGSYYHPQQSIWYVTGGPLPADHPEMLLLIGPGLDRNATVGFRLVKD